MEFSIKNTQVYGLERAVKASGNPMRTFIETGDCEEKDYSRAVKLGTCDGGEGHDNFLKGILVQMDVVAPLYWWKQAQRYHWFDFVSSQSTMHCLLKFDVKTQCTDDVDPQIIAIITKLIEQYNKLIDASEKKAQWRKIVASLPCGFCLGATMTTNYQQLKTMYRQRAHHKLEEWSVFCAWCQELPEFIKLTQGQK